MKMKNSKKISMTQQEIQSDVKDSLNRNATITGT